MPYMEKDDVLNKDYFIDGFLGKTENDGRQYVLMKRFFISAMLCGSEAGEFVEASPARNIMPGLIKKYEDMPQGTVLVSGISGVDMYDVIMSGSVSDFMDYNDGTCSFNSGDYSQILEFCHKIEEEYVAGADAEENLSKDRALLTNRYIYGINDIRYDDVICGGDSCYVGYPAKEEYTAEDGAEQYIKGMKNLEDTINIIQDKAVKYVNENR